MKYIKQFDIWLNESNEPLDLKVPWTEMKFSTTGEKEVADVAEETLLTKNLFVIEEKSEMFKKLSQIVSTTEGEPVLEVNGHTLTLIDTPFEFIKWDKLGATPSEIIESCFIVKGEDINKIA
jgi:hypothetical protein